LGKVEPILVRKVREGKGGLDGGDLTIPGVTQRKEQMLGKLGGGK